MNRFILLGLLAVALILLLQSQQGQAASTKKAEAKAVAKKAVSAAKKKSPSTVSGKKTASKDAKKISKVSSKKKKKAVSKDKKKAVGKDKKPAKNGKKVVKGKKATSKKKKAASKDKKAVSKDKKVVRKDKKVVSKGKKAVSKDKQVASKGKKASKTKKVASKGKTAVGKDKKVVSKGKKASKTKKAVTKGKKVGNKDKKVASKDKKASKNKKAAKKRKAEKKAAAKKAEKNNSKKTEKKADKKVAKKDKKAKQMVKKVAIKARRNKKKQRNTKVCLQRKIGYRCSSGKRVRASTYKSCIHFCQNNKNCRSIDWNTKRRLCLLHTRAKRLHRTIQNIIHVAKVSCTQIPRRIWPRKSIEKSKPAPGGCMRRIRTLYTFSVRRVVGLATAVQCRYWCWKNKRCRYVDWDQRHRSCWTHGDLKTKEKKPRRDMHNWPYAWTYVKIRCPWYPKWTGSSQEGRKSKGGRDISAAYKYVSRKGSCDKKTLLVMKKTNLTKCFKACDKTERCISFVYRKKDADDDDDDDDDDDEPSYPRCYLKGHYCPKLKDRDNENVVTYNKALAGVTKLKLPKITKGEDAKSMDPCQVIKCPEGSVCVARPICDKTKKGGAACKVIPSCAKKLSKENIDKKTNVACPGKKWKKDGGECVFTPFHVFNYAIKTFKKIEMRDNRKCPVGTTKRAGRSCKVMSHPALEKTFVAHQEMSRVVSLKKVEMFIRVKPGEKCPDGFGRMKGEKDACQVTDEDKVRRLNRKALEKRKKVSKKDKNKSDKKRTKKAIKGKKGKQSKNKAGKDEKKEAKEVKKKAAKKDSKKSAKNGKKKAVKKAEKASKKGDQKTTKKSKRTGGKKLSTKGKKSPKKSGERESKTVSKKKGSKKSSKKGDKSKKSAEKVSKKSSESKKKGSQTSKVGKTGSKKGGKKSNSKKSGKKSSSKSAGKKAR